MCFTIRGQYAQASAVAPDHGHGVIADRTSAFPNVLCWGAFSELIALVNVLINRTNHDYNLTVDG